MSRTVGSRILHPGYAKALKMIVFGGATWAQIAAALDVNRLTAQRLVRCFHQAGMAHISGWAIDGPTAKSRKQVYSFGPGVDVLWPGGERPKRPLRMPVELLTFCHAIKALQADLHHGSSLAAETGMGMRNARGLLRALHECRLIYIADFEARRIGGTGAAMYAWGPRKKDKQKPVPATKQERWTANNARRAIKAHALRLSHAVVKGFPMDKRTAAYKAANAQGAAA